MVASGQEKLGGEGPKPTGPESWLKKPSWVNLDSYQKTVCPTLQWGLTLVGIVIAYQVFVVHRQTFETRLEKQDEFSKTLGEQQARQEEQTKTLRDHQKSLEQQNKTLREQQSHLEQTVKISDLNQAREADKLNTALGLTKNSIEQLETAKDQYKLIIDVIENTGDRFFVATALGLAESMASNQAISYLGILLSKTPIYTPDEQAFLKTIIEIANIHNETMDIYIRNYKNCHETCKQLRANCEKAIKLVPQQRQALSKACSEEISRQGERFKLQLEKDLAIPSERLKQLRATQAEIMMKLRKAEKKTGLK
jgi:hypothetical protein